jgi:RNA-binding protein
MLTGKQKRELRAKGNQLKPEVWIGREGVTSGCIQTIENSFNTKELLKIKIQENCPLEKEQLTEIVCNRTGAELIQILGNTFLLYRSILDNDN